MKEFLIPMKSDPNLRVEKGTYVSVQFTDHFVRVQTDYRYKANVAEDGDPEWEVGRCFYRETIPRSVIRSSSIDNALHGENGVWIVNEVSILAFDTDSLEEVMSMDDYLHEWACVGNGALQTGKSQ